MPKKIEKIEAKDAKRYNPSVDTGLNAEQVNERIESGLSNSVDRNRNSILKIICKNVFTFFNVMYIIIFILLFTAEVPISNYLFVVIVLVNLSIGTFQEIRSKLTIEKLALISESLIKVVRDGNIVEIRREELVLDDIMVLSAGQEIASDSILVNGEIEVNESQLTGESVAIRKNIGDTLYSGSIVVSGNCYALVERVGKDNQIEKLSAQAKTYVKPKSEIFNSLNFLLKFVATVIIPLGIIMYLMTYRSLDINIETGIEYTFHEKYAISVEKTSGALLGMIPSGLYLLTSVALALGVLKLSKHRTLVHDIYCIEMLARVDVLCLDKTGTITDGTMSVTRYIEEQRRGEYNVREIVACMNSALNEKNFTAKALENYFGFSKVLTPIDICPFKSDNKYSAVTFEGKGTFIIGAPEFVLKSNYGKIEAEVNEYANQGLRVLALAHSPYPLKDGKIQKLPKLVALILIEDQIRHDAIDTIRYFKNNNVEVKIISGDNPLTVSEVAKRVGVENADYAISLDGLSDEEVYNIATKYTVFGRVKPNQKQILVKALKDAKHTVAMTGDGVNDILALKEADCSIAMASGCDAVKRVAQLVLLDSNFNAMPRVVGEGRRVINNIQQTSMLFLVKTLFIIFLSLLFVSGFLKRFGPDGSINSFPISPSQLMIIELFAIGIPAFFLALQPNYNKIQGHFLYNVIKRALPGALAVAVEIMFTYIFSKVLGLSSSEVVTIVTIVATATCMMILFMACKPFSILKALMFIILSFASISVVYLSTTGKNLGGISFQEQFKLFSIFKDDVKEVRHDINRIPGDLMVQDKNDKDLYYYTIEVPSRIPKDAKVYILFGNGIVNYTYETNLFGIEDFSADIDVNSINNHYKNGEWVKAPNGEPLTEKSVTIYYTNDQNWDKVYAYIYYETIEEVKDATPLLLAFALSETSYIIIFVFNYFINVFSMKKLQQEIKDSKIKKKQEEEDFLDK